jgi:methionine aminopeptidase
MESESVLSSDTIAKYNTSATICGKVYKHLKALVISNQERDIKNLCNIGNQMILSELSTIYKKNKDKNIAFPVCISLNNMISNHTGEIVDLIKDTDIIKIKLGVSLCGCISILTETFIIKENKPIQRIINFLDDISENILEMIKHEETVDEVRIFIESKCTEQTVFPISNCISYQQEQSFIKTLDSKYIILNHQAKYDMNDYLLTEQNINFEFEEDDIFTINLTVIPIEDDIEPNYVKYCTLDGFIHRINETNYNLKLKSSKEFYSKVKKEYSYYAFDIKKYLDNPRDRMGILECKKHNLLDVYDIITVHNNLPVISKEFTIIISKNNSKKLKYAKD